MTVQIFVNLLDGQAPTSLPPEAQPLRMPNREPELREWQAIEHIYRERLFDAADHTALLSSKFPDKTGLSFDTVASFIAQNPGHDLYLFDHGPQLRYCNFNLLEQCDHILPGYAARFIDCFSLIGEDVDFTTLGRSLPDNAINGNGWVGNGRFWREVIGEAVRLIESIRARPEVWRYLCEPVIHNGHVYPYLPFIFERFVSWWLMTRPGLSVKAYPYDKEYVLARCVRPMEVPIVTGFHDLFNQWDADGVWSPDRREFIRDLSLAFHRQLRGANDHMVYPWSGERIAPVK